jgi:hypothetical protein
MCFIASCSNRKSTIYNSTNLITLCFQLFIFEIILFFNRSTNEFNYLIHKKIYKNDENNALIYYKWYSKLELFEKAIHFFGIILTLFLILLNFHKFYNNLKKNVILKKKFYYIYNLIYVIDILFCSILILSNIFLIVIRVFVSISEKHLINSTYESDTFFKVNVFLIIFEIILISNYIGLFVLIIKGLNMTILFKGLNPEKIENNNDKKDENSNRSVKNFDYI